MGVGRGGGGELSACRPQGRSGRDGTLRRVQRRSFTPASFLEEDTVDFPDELDTSFFARVRARSQAPRPRPRVPP